MSFFRLGKFSSMILLKYFFYIILNIAMIVLLNSLRVFLLHSHLYSLLQFEFVLVFRAFVVITFLPTRRGSIFYVQRESETIKSINTNVRIMEAIIQCCCPVAFNKISISSFDITATVSFFTFTYLISKHFQASLNILFLHITLL